jgi:hypothetical protein
VPPFKLFVDLTSTSLIYKLHGAVDRTLKEWDSYVITEEDCVALLNRLNQKAIPACIINHLRGRRFLFLGYEIADWNLRLQLNALKKLRQKKSQKDTDVRSWAVQARHSTREKELWLARNVRHYDLEIHEFVRRLRDHST